MRSLLKQPAGIFCFWLMIVFVLSACTSGSNTKTEKQKPLQTHTIEIKQMAFSPAEITVSKGDTVVFINHDPVDHDITDEDKKSWSSSPLPPGQSWSKVIEEPANYFCSLHVVMKGKIIVK